MESLFRRKLGTTTMQVMEQLGLHLKDIKERTLDEFSSKKESMEASKLRLEYYNQRRLKHL